MAPDERITTHALRPAPRRRRMPTAPLRVLLGLCLCVGVLAAPTAASAMTVARDGTTDPLTYQFNVIEQSAESNNLTVKINGSQIEFRDSGALVTVASLGCTSTGTIPADRVVSCDTAGIPQAQVFTGLGDDTVTIDTSGGIINANMNGGTGSDHLNGGGGEDAIFGYKTAPATGDGVKAGDDNTTDFINGGGGGDYLFGDGGDDQIDAADGMHDSALNCGPGAGDVITLDSGIDPAAVYCETQNGTTTDTTAPDTLITSAPSGTTASTDATIAYGSSESPGYFDCRLTQGTVTLHDWADCSGAGDPQQASKSYAGLADGTYTFSVRAVDGADNVDATPSTATWTVQRPADALSGSPGSGGATVGGAFNLTSPTIVGRPIVGQPLTCLPGNWADAASFTFAWYRVYGDSSDEFLVDGQSYTVGVKDAGLHLECIVRSGSAAPDVRVAIEAQLTQLPTYPIIKRAFPNYLPGTLGCGSKKWCEAEQVRTDLTNRKLNITWTATAARGLRDVPAALRRTISPGEVFVTSPAPGTRITSGPDNPLKVKVKYYLPDPTRNCALDDVIEVRNGRDYTVAEAMQGLPLSVARQQLKQAGCTVADYRITYRYTATKAPAPVVSGARVRSLDGRDVLVLTVDHPAASLQLGVEQGAVRSSDLPLMLSSARNEVTLARSVRQPAEFDVAVATIAGSGFRDARVDLQDPAGEIVKSATTAANGVAHFVAPIHELGTYKLWVSIRDSEGDSLVGWKTISAVDPLGPNRSDKDFLGLDGKRYVFDGAERFKAAAAAHSASALAHAAASEPTYAATVEQAARVCAGAQRTWQSDAGQAYLTGLTNEQIGSIGGAIGAVCVFGEGKLPLQTLINLGVVPQLATVGGTDKLAVGLAKLFVRPAYVFSNGHIVQQDENAIAVDGGALGFVTPKGVVLYPDGTYTLPGGGGNGFRNAGVSPISVSATDRNLAIELLGRSTLVGIVAGGAGNILATDGATILATDGATILATDGATILATDGATVVAGGAGNVVAGGAGNIVGDAGASIVAGGAGNVVAGGAGN
jgi:hypothetical protein